MEALSLYIHIPFCEQKCPYCDFFSISDSFEYDVYTEELIMKIIKYSSVYKRNISTIYFGGGTPSVLGTERLIKILSSIYDSFSVSNDAEVTIEVNPCSANNLDFYRLRKVGFNRLSIGLQSSDTYELKILGRKHTPEDAKRTVENARKAGFENISLDLMICVPTQTKNSLANSIEFCEGCNVEHISAYILKVEKNTLFYKMQDKYRFYDEETQSQMYLFTVNELKKHGYNQYEISNFSKTGFEGKHNLRYWRDQEYLGLGPSAHSYVDGNRFYYSRDINDFYNDIIFDDGEGGDIEEYIMLSLRLKEGLNLKSLKDKYNYTPSKNFNNKINTLKKAQLLEFDNDIISLTLQGFLVSNSVISFLISEL